MDYYHQYKREARQIVRQQVKHFRTITEVIEDVTSSLNLVNLSTLLDNYVKYKFFKYCFGQLEMYLVQVLTTEPEKMSFEKDILYQLTGDMLAIYKENFESVSSPIVLDNRHYNLIKHAWTSNFRPSPENWAMLSMHSTSRTFEISSGQILKFDAKTLEEWTLPSKRFISCLVEYLTDYKTQFVCNLNIEDLIRVSNESEEEDEETFIPAWSKMFYNDPTREQQFTKIHNDLKGRLEHEKQNFNSELEELLQEEWNKIGTELTKPMEQYQEKLGDKVRLVVFKPVLVLSLCLNEIENILKTEGLNITEVRFEASKVFYIDTSLKKDCWHGKNLVVLAESITCAMDGLIWNVSGLDGLHGIEVSSRNGNNNHNGNPMRATDGADGEPGESGGNLVFRAKDYHSLHYLQIVTCGGDGGNGEDGANGTDGEMGKDGVALNRADLIRYFKVPVKLLKFNEKTLEEKIGNIRRKTEDFGEEIFKNFDADGKEINRTDSVFPTRAYYLEGMMNDGFAYQFSYSQRGTKRDAYMLVKGSKGSKGGLGQRGGIGGKSGEGGEPGTVAILDRFGRDWKGSNVGSVVRSKGKEGNGGAYGFNGANGIDGRDGHDVGYMDKWRWKRILYFDDRKKYEVRRSGGVNVECKVWCEVDGEYKTIGEVEKKPERSQNTNLSLQQQNNSLRQNKVVGCQKKNKIDIEKTAEVFAQLVRSAFFQEFSNGREKESVEENTNYSRNADTSLSANASQIIRKTPRLISSSKKCHPSSNNLEQPQLVELMQKTVNKFGADKALLEVMEHLPKDLCQEMCIFLLEKNAEMHDGIDSQKILQNILIKVVESTKIVPLTTGKVDYNVLVEARLGSIDEWIFKLEKLHILSFLESIPGEDWSQKSELIEAFYYIVHLSGSNEHQVKDLLQVYKELKQRSESQLQLAEDDDNLKIRLVKVLEQFYSGSWSLTEAVLELAKTSPSVSNWISILTKMHKVDLESIEPKVRDIHEIAKVIKSDTVTTIFHPKRQQLIEWVVTVRESKVKRGVVSTKREDFLEELKEWCDDFKERTATHMKSGQQHNRINLILEAVTQIDHAIYFLQDQVRLRDNQLLAILAAFLGCDPDTNKRGVLAQVKTGEGKSYIALAVAIVRGLFHETSDIITSSNVLAQRDAQHLAEVYNAFGLTAGDVTSEYEQVRMHEYRNTVVYGEVTNFQKDFLIDHFYNRKEKLRGDRKFESIIIDEVDTMLLDKGNTVLYLSHVPPGVDTLEHLFLFIWKSVVDSVGREGESEFEPAKIYQYIMENIHPSLDKDELDMVPKIVLEQFRKETIIGHDGRISVKTLEENIQLDDADFDKESFLRLIRLKLSRKQELHIPNYLKEFVELHLITWIKSAYQATQLEEGVQYVLYADHLKTSSDRNLKIVIVDLDTGVDQKESQWSDGLHQFLQLKHGARLTNLSLKSVFVSNISYFQKYDSIFGLSGTLGMQSDRSFLVDTYNVELVNVPSAFETKFKVERPILCKREFLHDEIYSETLGKLKMGRSVLILSETVRTAEVLHRFLKPKLEGEDEKYKTVIYCRDFEPFDLIKDNKTLDPGTVIVATNLAGRGTNIKLCEELKKPEVGGLHVIFSYLPSNARVQWQGFGRSARSGAPGSGRLIFCPVDSGFDEECTLSPHNHLVDRDEREMGWVAELKAHYENVVKKEEEKFEHFREVFDKFRSSMEKAYESFLERLKTLFNGKDDDKEEITMELNNIKDIVRYNVLDDWAFWLDAFSTHLQFHAKLQQIGTNKIKTHIDLHRKEKIQLEKGFQKMLARYADITEKYENEIPEEVEVYATELVHEPALLVKLAKCYMSRKDFPTALNFLEKVLKEEEPKSLNATVALYYKIYCSIKMKSYGENKSQADEFWWDVEIAKRNLERLAALQLEMAQTVEDSRSIGLQKIHLMDVLRRQKEAAAAILLEFKNSLDDLVGKGEIESSDFQDLFGDNEDVAQLCVFQLLQKGEISKHKINGEIEKYKFFRENLEKLSRVSMIQPNHLETVFLENAGKIVENQVRETMKAQLNLPSKSGFWTEILPALVKSIDVAIILGGDVSVESEPETRQDLLNWYTKKTSTPKHVSRERFLIAKHNSPLSLQGKFMSGSKVLRRNDPEFLHFEKSNRLLKETVAGVDRHKLGELKLQSHYKIDEDDFKTFLQVSKHLASEIFKMCQNEKIIDNGGILQTTEIHLSLSIIQSSISSLLAQHVVFKLKDDIINLIKVKCCYQLERLLLLEKIESSLRENDESVTQLDIVNLGRKPFDIFIFEAINLGLIKNTCLEILETEEEDDNEEEEGAPEITPETILTTVLGQNQDKEKRTSHQGKILFRDLSLIFPKCRKPFLYKLWSQLEESGWILNNGDILLEMNEFGKLMRKDSENQFESTDKKEISPVEKFCLPHVLPLMTLRVMESKRKFRKQLKKRLAKLRGTLNTIENADATLGNLQSESCYDDQHFRQEVLRFKLNALDLVLCGTEELHSRRMMVASLAVLVMGSGQIIGGALLATNGVAPFGAALISSGVDDVVFSLLAFTSGRFNWNVWKRSKLTSLAVGGSGITLLGIGDATVTTILTSAGQEVVLQFVKEEFSRKFTLWTDQLINFVTERITKHFCDRVKFKVRGDVNLKDALFELVFKMEQKMATKKFDEICNKVTEKSFRNINTFIVIGLMKRYAIDKTFEWIKQKKDELANEQVSELFSFDEMIKKAETSLQSIVNQLFEQAGISELATNLIKDMVKEIEFVLSEIPPEEVLIEDLDIHSQHEFVEESQEKLFRIVERLMVAEVEGNLKQPMLDRAVYLLRRFVASRRNQRADQGFALLGKENEESLKAKDIINRRITMEMLARNEQIIINAEILLYMKRLSDSLQKHD